MSEPTTGPLVTDEIRSCIGVASAPAPLQLERERIPLILNDLGLPLSLGDGPVLEDWLVAGLSPSMGPTNVSVPELLPMGALVQLGWQFFAPFRIDLGLTVASEVTDVRDRVGGRYGHTVVVTTRSDIFAADTELLASLGVTRIQFRPPESPEAFRAARGLRDDTAEVSVERGPFPEQRDRWFEDVRAGDEIGPVVRVATPATIDAFLPRSARGRVTQSNSSEAALSAGYEGLVVPLSAQMCWIALLAVRWAGAHGRLQYVRAAFREPDYAGRPIIVRGRVAALARERDEGVADLECVALSSGLESVRASVRVGLPLRERGHSSFDG